MEYAMIGGVSPSAISVGMRVYQGAAQREAPQQEVQPVQAGATAPPLVNPMISVDTSGLVVVQYRNESGDIRLQVPSETVVRAYRQRSAPQPAETEQPSAADRILPQAPGPVAAAPASQPASPAKPAGNEA